MTLSEVVRLHQLKPVVRFKHPETVGYIRIDYDGSLWRITKKGHVFRVVLDLTDLIRADWEEVQ